MTSISQIKKKGSKRNVSGLLNHKLIKTERKNFLTMLEKMKKMEILSLFLVEKLRGKRENSSILLGRRFSTAKFTNVSRIMGNNVEQLQSATS